VVIKGLKVIMSVESAVIIYIIDLQYVPVARVVDVNCRCYSYRVQDRGSGVLYFLFFYLPLYTLFLLNLFLKLR